MIRTLGSVLMIAIGLSVSGFAQTKAGDHADKQPARDNRRTGSAPDIVTPESEPKKVVYQALKRLCEVKSYRTRTQKEMTGPNGMTILTISDFVGADRRRSIRFVAGPDESKDARIEQTTTVDETITIGSRSYRRSNGPWTELKGPLSYSENGELGVKCPLEKDVDNLPSNLKLLGPGEVKGTKVLFYRPAAGSETTFAVGVKDGLLYRVDWRSGIFVTGSTEPEGFITSTTYYSDYNAEITIESPVK